MAQIINPQNMDGLEPHMTSLVGSWSTNHVKLTNKASHKTTLSNIVDIPRTVFAESENLVL